jgi:hypothetical protein
VTQKIKFVIGTPDAIWTSAWFIFTDPKSNVYVGNVGFTSAVKLSFHASGAAHFRYLDRPELGTLAKKFVQQWERPPTPAPGWTHVFSVHFPTDFLKARSPHNSGERFLTIAPAPTGEAIEVGLFYSRGLRVEHIQRLGNILLFRHFPTGEDVWAVQRSAPFDPSKVPQLSQLLSGSLALPDADWVSSEIGPGSSLDSVGMILRCDPEKDGLAQMIEVTGLRWKYTPAQRNPGTT